MHIDIPSNPLSRHVGASIDGPPAWYYVTQIDGDLELTPVDVLE